MPIKPTSELFSQESASSDSSWMDTAKKLIPTGVRVASGIVGSIPSAEPGFGTAIGSAIGGGGEALAQLLEGKSLGDLDKTKIATEAALTAVPLGKIFKSGQYLKSALRGAAFGEGSNLVRKGVDRMTADKPSTEPFLGKDDLIAAGMGAGMGAIAARPGKVKVPAAPAPAVPASITSAEGFNAAINKAGFGGFTPEESAQLEAALMAEKSQSATTRGPLTKAMDNYLGSKGQVKRVNDTFQKPIREAEKAQGTAQKLLDTEAAGDVQITGEAEKAKQGAAKQLDKDLYEATRASGALDKAQGQHEALAARGKRAEAAAQLEANRLKRVEGEKAGKDYVPPTSVSQSISATNPQTGARESVRGTWVTPPKEEGGGSAFDQQAQDLLDQVIGKQKQGNLLPKLTETKSMKGGQPTTNAELSELGIPTTPATPNPAITPTTALPKVPKVAKMPKLAAQEPLTDDVRAELQKMHDELDMHDASQQHIIQNDKGENVKALNISAPNVYTDITQNAGLNSTVDKVKQSIKNVLEGKNGARGGKSAVEVAQARLAGKYVTPNGTKITSGRRIPDVEISDYTGGQPEHTIEVPVPGETPTLEDIAAQVNKEAPQVAKVNFPSAKIQGSSLPTGEQQGAMFGEAPKAEADNLFEQAAKTPEAPPPTEAPKPTGLRLAAKEDDLIKGARSSANEYRTAREGNQAAGHGKGTPEYAQERELGAKAAQGSAAVKRQNLEDIKLLEGLDPATRAQAIKNIIKDFMSSEKGSVSTVGALRGGLATVGGLGGYAYDPVGDATGQHSQETRMMSALLLGGMGAASPEIINSLPEKFNLKNVFEHRKDIPSALNSVSRASNSLLLSPLSTLKKLMGDVSGLASAASENPELAGNLVRTLMNKRPEILDALKKGYTQDFLTEESTGLEKVIQNPKNPLSVNPRAMAALTAATKKIMTESGFTPEQAAYYTLTSKPGGNFGKIYDLWLRSPLFQHLSPFARIGLNRLERGFERSPAGLIRAPGAENVEDFRRILDLAARGTAVGLAANQLTPEGFVSDHPVLASTISAGSGIYGIPVLAGMALSSRAKSPVSQAARDIANDVPGLRTLEDVTTSPAAFGRNYLSRYTNVVGPIAKYVTDPNANPEVNKDLTSKALANIPYVRSQLPQKQFKGIKLAGVPKIHFE